MLFAALEMLEPDAGGRRSGTESTPDLRRVFGCRRLCFGRERQRTRQHDVTQLPVCLPQRRQLSMDVRG